MMPEEGAARSIGSSEKGKLPPSSVPIDWRKLHLWQIQPIRDLLAIGAVFLLAYLGYVLSLVTVPLLLALLLAYLFEPLIQRITRGNHITRKGAAIGVIVVAALVVVVPLTVGIGFAAVQGAGAAATLASTTGNLVKAMEATSAEDRQRAMSSLSPSMQEFGQWFIDLRAEVHQHRAVRDAATDGQANTPGAEQSSVPARDSARDAAGPKTGTNGAESPAAQGPVKPAKPGIPTWREHLVQLLDFGLPWIRDNAAAIGKAIGTRAVGGGAQAIGVVVSALAGLGMILFKGLLTAFFFFFFSTGWGRVLRFWESLIPERRKGRVFDLLARMDRVIAGFVRGRLTICAVLMVYVTIAYWFIGVPAPLIAGPIVGLLFLIPYCAGLGAAMAIILMALNSEASPLAQQWWWIVFAPIAVNIGGQILDDYVLSPTIQGKNTDMDTPTILFASIAGGVLAGVYGLLLAIPIAACLKILVKETVMPRIKAWAEGKAPDLLPISNQ